MDQTKGSPEVKIGLIDGPVVMSHPDFAIEQIHQFSRNTGGSCTISNSIACLHGTFIAGVLCAKRSSVVPGICPGSTLLIRPIFKETALRGGMPSATPVELSEAIMECIKAGVHVINLSAALLEPSLRDEHELEGALDHAARRGVIVVAAAGNQGTVGGSAITRHPWVIPVTACDLTGRPLDQSNIGRAIGRHGLRAPGDSIIGLGTGRNTRIMGGTSVAAPFVTGAITLLWSLFPNATATQIIASLTGAYVYRRHSLVPPLLNGWAAYNAMTVLGKPKRSLA